MKKVFNILSAPLTVHACLYCCRLNSCNEAHYLFMFVPKYVFLIIAETSSQNLAGRMGSACSGNKREMIYASADLEEGAMVEVEVHGKQLLLIRSIKNNIFFLLLNYVILRFLNRPF